MRLIKFLLILLFVSQAQMSWAQLSQRPVTNANQIEADPMIDGNVIGDDLWKTIDPITEMIQVRPDNGKAASERTEIRIAYTSSTLYLAVVCYDTEPGKLVVSDSRRDASLDGTDSFLFILDTYNDGQNGFVFGTSSNGVEYDGQVDNEGQQNFTNNRQQGGRIGGFNLNWDTSWEVQAEVGDYGWSAEFAIPMRSLRFNSGDNQSWGINFQRNIRKTNEIAYWAPLPLQFDLNRLSLAGDIEGLNLVNPGNLKMIPYVLRRAVKDYEVTDPTTDVEREVGLDVKYSITPSITLDMTYNTDFAQVEVDNEQVNLDRFNLFFPEKRPFFLENAGQFSVGSPGEVDLFFSRRIGIGDEGQIVPIVGGARVSGKVNDTNIGGLSMFTDDVSNSNVSIERNNFSVLRVNHQLAERSTIGAAFMNRQSMGGLQNGEVPTDTSAYNRTFALDGKWGLGKKAQVSGFFAKTQTPQLKGDDYSFKLESQYSWDNWLIILGYTEVADNFNPELGFLARSSFKKKEILVFKTHRFKEGNKMNMLEMRPHISYRGFWNFDDFQETGFLHVDNHWVWKGGFEIHTGVNFTTEGVVDDFPIFDKQTTDVSREVIVPAGTYEHTEAQIVFVTNPSKNVYASTRHVMGGSFGGNRIINSGTLGLRFGDKFNSEFSLQRNDFDLPDGKFQATVFGSRISYSFTPKISTQYFGQYNSLTNVVSANLRLGWLKTANTGLFVVFNKNWGNASRPYLDAMTSPLNQTFTIKYSHQFDVIK